jgi:hypothetical protein
MMGPDLNLQPLLFTRWKSSGFKSLADFGKRSIWKTASVGINGLVGDGEMPKATKRSINS